LFTAGHPVLTISQSYNRKNKTATIVIEQTQSALFIFPLQLLIASANGKEIKTITVKDRTTTVVVPAVSGLTKITPDPVCDLLFEEQTKPGGR